MIHYKTKVIIGHAGDFETKLNEQLETLSKEGYNIKHPIIPEVTLLKSNIVFPVQEEDVLFTTIITYWN